MSEIKFATTDAEIEKCFQAMNELRPHLSPEAFFNQVKRQQNESGYNLVYLEEEAQIRSVAGFCIRESLAWGRHMNIDDLVTRTGDRGKGYGEQLFTWLVTHAKVNGCGQVHLDSGVQRFESHHFYMKKRMAITSHHFCMRIS